MFFVVIGAVIGLIVCISVAWEFHSIAAMKGHDEVKYFLWTLFLGPIGMLMVIALPLSRDAVFEDEDDEWEDEDEEWEYEPKVSRNKTKQKSNKK